MSLRYVVLIFLSITRNLADENLFSKFVQNDYDVKNERITLNSYNKELLKELAVLPFKYNRTTRAFNMTIVSKVDIANNDVTVAIQTYRRYGNEFKIFPISLSYKWCLAMDENVMGSAMTECGIISCPIRKEIRQSICNWRPDYSHLPPLIPDGEYILTMNSTYHNRHLFHGEYLATVYRKFHQHDYDVKNCRVGSVAYNNEFLEDLSIVYRRHNRSTMAMNLSILARVDLTKNNVYETAQVYKRYGNEYKYFPIRISYKWCTIFEENILGFGTNPWGRLSCPIKKDVRQTMYNWTPDFSRLPPLVPEGDYMVKLNTTNQNKYLYSIEYFGTVYRKIKIPN
ncbi:hypothetical protein FQR65_LT12295 [Abscondita terminalis]|nr:hypothetical protein FQR65_LT12295 [Abscondita terminalis]